MRARCLSVPLSPMEAIGHRSSLFNLSLRLFAHIHFIPLARNRQDFAPFLSLLSLWLDCRPIFRPTPPPPTSLSISRVIVRMWQFFFCWSLFSCTGRPMKNLALILIDLCHDFRVRRPKPKPASLHIARDPIHLPRSTCCLLYFAF